VGGGDAELSTVIFAGGFVKVRSVEKARLGVSTVPVATGASRSDGNVVLVLVTSVLVPEGNFSGSKLTVNAFEFVPCTIGDASGFGNKVSEVGCVVPPGDNVPASVTVLLVPPMSGFTTSTGTDGAKEANMSPSLGGKLGTFSSRARKSVDGAFDGNRLSNTLAPTLFMSMESKNSLEGMFCGASLLALDAAREATCEEKDLFLVYV
jgi:hypothetical protein